MKIQPISRAELISQYSGTLSNLAANAGIDLSKINLNYPTYGNPRTKNIHSSKEFKGKVYAHVNHYRSKDNNEHFKVTFGNLKTGVKESFCSFTEWKNDNNVINFPITKRATAAELAIKAELEEAARIAEEAKIEAAYQLKMHSAHYRWNNATTENVDLHDYFVRKGQSTEGIELRRGVGMFGNDAILYPLHAYDGTVTAYQEIYPTQIKGRSTDKNFVGRTGGAFTIIGDRTRVANGCILVEGLSTGLAVYHANGTGKTQLNNADKTPVIVCLDANNLVKVAKILKSKGFTNIQIAADNDCGLNSEDKFTGNKGIYSAIEAAFSIGLGEILVPQLNDLKCDFCDTLEFTTMSVPSRFIHFTMRKVKYIPDNELNKTLDKLIELAAGQVFNEFPTVDDATRMVISARLKRSQLSEDELIEFEKSVSSRIEECLKAARYRTVKNNRPLSIAKTKTFDVTGRDYRGVCNMIKFIASDNNALIFDNRAMGEGKTLTLKELANDYSNHSIMYLSHRISIIADTAKRLGFQDYQEVSDNVFDTDSAVKLAVCINSLERFKGNNADILFIDEARQVFETVVNGTNIEHPLDLIDCLQKQMQQSKLIVLADAGINDATIAFYKSLVKGKEVKLITSNAVVMERDYFTIDGAGTAIDKICDDLIIRNKSVVVGCTAKAKAEQVYAELKGRGFDEERLILITGDNKGDAKQAAFLSNPNEEGLQYDGIIYSPAIASGVSLTMEKFQTTYLIKSSNLAANESMQMLMRNRVAREIFVAFDEQSGYQSERRVTNLDVLKRGEVKRQSNDSLRRVTVESLGPLIIERLKLLSKRNADLNDSKREFLLLAELEGRHFKDSGLTPLKIKGLSKSVTEMHVTKTFNSDIIEFDKFEELKKSSALTQEESYQVKRYETVLMTGLEAEEITVEDVENTFNRDMGKLVNFELLATDTAELLKIDIENREKFKGLKSLVSRKKIFNEFITPLKKAGDRLTERDAAKALAILKKHSDELSDIGDYSRTFKSPVKAIGCFAKRFGYQVFETKKNDKKHFYKIEPMPHIQIYAQNRARKKEMELAGDVELTKFIEKVVADYMERGL
jgi:phage/plasmid primase-like uncharacterized protein